MVQPGLGMHQDVIPETRDTGKRARASGTGHQVDAQSSKLLHDCENLGNEEPAERFGAEWSQRTGPSVDDDIEIEWRKDQLAKNRALLDELEAGNTAGGEVFPETQSRIDRLKAQIAQSELIVAGYEKEHPER
jgi:hypothetical protein